MLATGEEITIGDVLNTNTRYIAQQLTNHDIAVGSHLVVSDNQKEIENGILYLLETHRVLITIGGLGPTSDDRTRFALSEALKIPLVFDEDSWQRILKLLSFRYPKIPESNRQQCLFPAAAQIIANPNGTASACVFQYQEHWIAMLPGPPLECRPLFDRAVLPLLMSQGMQQPVMRKSWLFIGVSEAGLAEKLDPLFVDSTCNIGYRVDFPYVELKVSSTKQKFLEEKISAILPLIANYHIVSTTKQKASQQLQRLIAQSQHSYSITDHVTYGHLQKMLVTPETFNKLTFDADVKAEVNFFLHGLEAYWQNQPDKELTFSIDTNGDKNLKQIKIPNRGSMSLLYAVEWICWELLQHLTATHHP